MKKFPTDLHSILDEAIECAITNAPLPSNMTKIHEWLEIDGWSNVTDAWVDEDNVLELKDLAKHNFYDSVVREHEDLEDKDTVTDKMRIKHARAILNGLIEDGYEGSKYVFSIQIIRNDGESAIIGALGEIHGQAGIVAVWHGVFQDKQAFYNYLRKSQFLLHSEVNELKDIEILSLWEDDYRDEEAEKEVVEWVEDGAEEQFNLGMMYDSGQGVVQNYQEAVKWYRLAATQGDADAQNNLGMMYYDGRGVAQNYQEALKWFRLAVAQGQRNAQTSLGWMYDEGIGVNQNYQEALKWYRLGAAQGFAEAQNNLGWMYQNAKGVTQDFQEALKLYRLAAALGNIESTNRLHSLEKIAAAQNSTSD